MILFHNDDNIFNYVSKLVPSVALAEQVGYNEAAGKLLQLLVLQDPERGDGGRGHQHRHQPRQLQCR